MTKEPSPATRLGARNLVRRLTHVLANDSKVTPEQLFSYLAEQHLVSLDEQEQVLRLAIAECRYWEKDFSLNHPTGDLYLADSELAEKYHAYSDADDVLTECLDAVIERVIAELDDDIRRLMAEYPDPSD